MSWWDKVKGAFVGNAAKQLPAERTFTRGETEALIQRALQNQSRDYIAELKKTKRVVEPQKAFRRSPHMRDVEPGGNGIRKPFGISYKMQRAFARHNPWVRAAITIRMREMATAGYDIVPDLEHHQNELESLYLLVRSVQRFPDRNDVLNSFRPYYIDKEMVQALVNATNSSELSPADTRYRFHLAIMDLRREAEFDAAIVRNLFENPNPKAPPTASAWNSWTKIRAKFVEDFLTLDKGCFELTRAQFPLDPNYPIEDLVPSPNNRIVGIDAIDAATIRPCLDVHGQLRGIEDPYEDAWEQWIDGNHVQNWKQHQLLVVQEHPTTDVEMHGYSFGRVESLFFSMLIMARSDKADYQELIRDFYGGFLYLGPDQNQEDIEEVRVMLEEELEGDKQLPLLAGFGSGNDVKYIPATNHSMSKDARRGERQHNLMQRVAAHYEMSLLKLGVADKTNYRNSDVGAELMDEGFKKLASAFDEAATLGVVRSYGKRNIKYLTAPQHARDEGKQLENTEKKMDIGLWDINDMRIEWGRPPTEDGERSLAEYKAYGEAKGRTQGQAAGMADSDPTTPGLDEDLDEDGKNVDDPSEEKDTKKTVPPKKDKIPGEVKRALTDELFHAAEQYYNKYGKWPTLDLFDEDED